MSTTRIVEYNRLDRPFSFSGICSALREVRIQIPTAVKKGDSAILNCWYDTEGDQLYAVKWYKGSREFYRYAPNENPVVKTFPILSGNLTVKVSPFSPPFVVSSPLPCLTDELATPGVPRAFAKSRDPTVSRRASKKSDIKERERARIYCGREVANRTITSNAL